MTSSEFSGRYESFRPWPEPGTGHRDFGANTIHPHLWSKLYPIFYTSTRVSLSQPMVLLVKDDQNSENTSEIQTLVKHVNVEWSKKKKKKKKHVKLSKTVVLRRENETNK